MGMKVSSVQWQSLNLSGAVGVGWWYPSGCCMAEDGGTASRTPAVSQSQAHFQGTGAEGSAFFTVREEVASGAMPMGCVAEPFPHEV